jgi:SPP1 gp7 family putative phage head morphogenesis protein
VAVRPAPPPPETVVHPFNARFLPALTLDRKRRPGRRNPTKTGRAEAQYRKALRSVAEHVGALITGMQEKNLTMVPSWTHLLGAYADALVPWAIRVSQRMLDEVNGRDLDSWRSLGEAISRQLHRDITRSPVGERMDDLLREQVTLIKSIPLEAAQRVQELTLKGLEDSTRSAEYIAEIMRSGEVAKSRAVLIARTEVARTAAVLNQVRAESAGSTHFTWKTANDASVRPDHKLLANKVFAWDDPPISDRRTGERALPGQIYNCRCYGEAIIPEDD